MDERSRQILSIYGRMDFVLICAIEDALKMCNDEKVEAILKKGIEENELLFDEFAGIYVP